MKRSLVGAIAVLAIGGALLTACDTGRVGGRCRGTGFGQDATNVLVCRSGRWQRSITKQQAAALIVKIINDKKAAETPPPPPPPNYGSAQTLSTNWTTTCIGVSDPPVNGVLTSAGGVYCVGGGSPTPRLVLQTGVPSVMDAEDNTTCAVASGSVWCWGENNWGQLGLPGGGVSDTPVRLPLDRVVDVAVANTFACAIVQTLPYSNTEMWCWGAEDQDEATSVLRPAPEYVPGSEDARSLSGGGRNVCATFADGTADCLGTFDPPTSALPFGISEINIGQRHGCIAATGAVSCWGDNERGQLGVPPSVTSLAAVAVPGVRANNIAVSDTFSCGEYPASLQGSKWTSGSVDCWGDNRQGQLGNGATSEWGGPTSVPLPPSTVPWLPDPVGKLDTGRDHACIIYGQRVMCWGSAANGQRGVDAPTFAPSYIPGFHRP